MVGLKAATNFFLFFSPSSLSVERSRELGSLPLTLHRHQIAKATDPFKHLSTDGRTAQKNRALDAIDRKNQRLGLATGPIVAEPTSMREWFDVLARECDESLSYPTHLQPLMDVSDRILRGEKGIRALISTPPQHGKSLSLLVMMLAKALFCPGIKIIYATYSSQLTTNQLTRFRHLLSQLPDPYPTKIDTDNQFSTDFANKSQIFWRSVGGACTGLPCDLLVMDDLLSDWKDAQSPTVRNDVFDFLKTVALTRAHSGTSIILNSTRWHRLDAIGLLSQHGNWLEINLPAISEDEEGNRKALWAERFPLEYLDVQRQAMGEHQFSTLYLGVPSIPGSQLYLPESTTYYTNLPQRYRVSIGADFAYSARKNSDYCVCLAMAFDDEEQRGYLLEVQRHQIKVSDFGGILKAFQTKYSGAKVYCDVSAPEKGTLDFLTREFGIQFKPTITQSAKLIRSVESVAAFNNGRISVPTSAEWLEPFLDELYAFTGTGEDPNDDQCDSLASAWKPFAKGKPRQLWSHTDLGF